MRCLRHATTVAFLGLLLGAAPAHAGDLAAAVRVANAVYPGVPQRCGTVTIEHTTLAPPNDTNGSVAEAYEADCRVRIKPGIATTFTNAELCSLVTHEWGHLAGRWFPENRDDPSHSPDPADNMYGPHLVHHPACGESDAARRAREASARNAAQDAATTRETRLEQIRDRLEVLKDRLRAAKAAKRRSRGVKRARHARRVRQLRIQMKRLRAEYRALTTQPVA